MSKKTTTDRATRRSEEFSRQADAPKVGLLGELFDFIVHNKKWWLAPILVVLLALGVFVFLSATPLAPFLYPF